MVVDERLAGHLHDASKMLLKAAIVSFIMLVFSMPQLRLVQFGTSAGQVSIQSFLFDIILIAILSAAYDYSMGSGVKKGEDILGGALAAAVILVVLPTYLGNFSIQGYAVSFIALLIVLFIGFLVGSVLSDFVDLLRGIALFVIIIAVIYLLIKYLPGLVSGPQIHNIAGTISSKLSTANSSIPK